MLPPKDFNLDSKSQRQISIFGSTGSIGQSTLDVIRNDPEKFKVWALVANSNVELLAQQINEFKPTHAVVVDESKYSELQSRIDLGIKTKIHCGSTSSDDLASSHEADLLVASVVGFAGLSSVLKALSAGVPVALANKESLVSGGKLVKAALESGKSFVLPVDSEHSAVFQLLNGNSVSELESITLTASGGPFLRKPIEDFSRIIPQEALAHPTWNMGKKISIDSATMFNKALEVIEASWLFSLPETKIGVLIHPQSIIHSLINFHDGTVLAHLSVPDMKGPIGFALNYPRSRAQNLMSKLNLAQVANLEFLEVDSKRFSAISLARSALHMGEAAGAVLNAANEEAVQRFLRGDLKFDRIARIVEQALEHFGSVNYSSLEDLREIDSQVRILSKTLN